MLPTLPVLGRFWRFGVWETEGQGRLVPTAIGLFVDPEPWKFRDLSNRSFDTEVPLFTILQRDFAANNCEGLVHLVSESTSSCVVATLDIVGMKTMGLPSS